MKGVPATFTVEDELYYLNAEADKVPPGHCGDRRAGRDIAERQVPEASPGGLDHQPSFGAHRRYHARTRPARARSRRVQDAARQRRTVGRSLDSPSSVLASGGGPNAPANFSCRSDVSWSAGRQAGAARRGDDQRARALECEHLPDLGRHWLAIAWIRKAVGRRNDEGCILPDGLRDDLLRPSAHVDGVPALGSVERVDESHRRLHVVLRELRALDGDVPTGSA